MAFYQNFGASANKQPDAFGGFTAQTSAPAETIQKPFSGLMSYVNNAAGNGGREVVSSRPVDKPMEGASANAANTISKQGETSSTALNMAGANTAATINTTPTAPASVQSAFIRPSTTRSFGPAPQTARGTTAITGDEPLFGPATQSRTFVLNDGGSGKVLVNSKGAPTIIGIGLE